MATPYDHPQFDERLSEDLHAALPEALVKLFEGASFFGNRTTLIPIVALFVWFGVRTDPRTRAWVLATLVAAFPLYAALKGIFVEPRPEGLTFTTGGPSSYSFPSGHATQAAAAYGALAVAMTRGSDFLRYGLAGVLILAVALARVVLGVHYLDDVLVGVLLGGLLVAVGAVWFERRPGPTFALGIGLAAAVLAFGLRSEPASTIGPVLGAAAGWYLFGAARSPDRRLLVVVAAGWLALAAVTVSILQVVSVPWTLELLWYVLLCASVFAVPHVVRGIDGDTDLLGSDPFRSGTR